MSIRAKWYVVAITVAVFATSPPAKRAWAWTQADASTASRMDASSRTEGERPVSISSAPASVGDEQPMMAEVPVELERRFNALRREFLDLETDVVHRWLTVLAIILTVMGLLVPVAGYLGFRRFREIEQEAQQALDKIRGHEQEAKERVNQMPAITAEDEDKEKVLEKAQAATADAGADVIDVAVTDALTLQRAGRIKEAIAKWNAIALVVESRDKDQAARAHFSVGYLSVNEEAFERAIESFTEAIRLQPGLVNAYYNRGIAKAKLGQWEAAIADYDGAIRLQPGFADAYSNRGIAKAKLGRWESGIADHDKAISLQPGLASAYNNRGNAKAGLGQLEAAIADHDEAIRLQPGLASAYNNRGNAKADLGQLEAAIADHDEAIRLQPGFADAYSNRGIAKAKLGRNAEAELDREQGARLAARIDRPDTASDS